MRIAEVARGVPFADVGRGKITQFFVDDKLCIGMKIYSMNNKRETEGCSF
jgi:hypothetical protein